MRKITHYPISPPDPSDPLDSVKKNLRRIMNKIPSEGIITHDEQFLYDTCSSALDAIGNLQYELEGYERGLKKDEPSQL